MNLSPGFLLDGEYLKKEYLIKRNEILKIKE